MFGLALSSRWAAAYCSHASRATLLDVHPHTETCKEALLGVLWCRFAQQQLTPAGLQEMQDLSETIHSHRLKGLYVDEEDGVLNIPSEAITDAEADNLIRLAEARVGIASARTFRTDIPDEDIELQEWFVSITEEKPWKTFIFSATAIAPLRSSAEANRVQSG
jgi:hypothetical protein